MTGWNNLMYSLTEVRTICISMFWSKITTVGITAGDSSFVPEELQSEDDTRGRQEDQITNDEPKEKFLAEAELWVPLRWGAPDSQEGDKASGQFHCWMMSSEFSSLLPPIKNLWLAFNTKWNCLGFYLPPISQHQPCFFILLNGK